MVEIMKSDRNERYEAPQPPSNNSNAVAAANANAAAAAAAAAAATLHQQHHHHHHHMHQQHPGASNGMATQMQHTRYCTQSVSSPSVLRR